MIETTPEDYEYLLKSFNIGASTAENDPLLESAQIETTEFHDLYFADRIDIVRGIKGSGKTALYKVLYRIREMAFDQKRILMSFGIETEGVPLFKNYGKIFDEFSEDDFEEFWLSYFLYLTFQAINEKREQLPEADAAVRAILDQLSEEERALLGKQLSIRERLARWMRHIRERKQIRDVEASLKPDKIGEALIFYPALKFNFGDRTDETHSMEPLSIRVRDKVVNLANSAKIRIWILLDRLDEVFLRRSDTECKGLRGLLRAAYRFSNPSLRPKLFVRDDIFDTLAAGGFTALTHIADRSSSIMSWSDEKLLLLVAKRLSNMPRFASHFHFRPEVIDGNREYQAEVFYQIFPKRIGRQATFEWLLSQLRDGNGQVTPRDVIDTVNVARTKQVMLFETKKEVARHFIEEEALRTALDEISHDKRDKFLFAEFPHLEDDIRLFQGGYSNYDSKTLESLLGSEYKKKVDRLRAIGFLEFDKKKSLWKVPVIWRKGLEITRGSARVT